MAFNIDATIKNMLSAAKAQIKNDWKSVKETAEVFLEQRKKRINKLADKRIANLINDKELKEFLDEEEIMFKDELLALQVITKSIAQKAANAALDVLWNAIRIAVPIVG